MPNRSQRVITTPTGKIGSADLSRTIYLRGSAAQTITGPDKDGIDACTAGFNFTLKNDSSFDSSIVPVSGQTIEGAGSLSVPAHASVDLELSPGGLVWVRVALVGS